MNEVIELINQRRSKPLVEDVLLTKAAQLHSDDMCSRHFMSHTGSNFSSPFSRITKAGYSWKSAGECVAYGQKTAADVVSSWMNSPGHRAILLGNYENIGVGITATYWTVDVATPSNSPTIPWWKRFLPW